MAELIVADASPLIVLARVGQLNTLALVAGKVIVPDLVAAECLQDLRRPGAQQIDRAFSLGLLSRQPKFPVTDAVTAPGLDAGESAAIGLAIALNAPLLIDERIGRHVAQLHAVKVIGSLGILLLAKERGIIDAIAPIIAALKEEEFFISSALEQAILIRAREGSSFK